MTGRTREFHGKHGIWAGLEGGLEFQLVEMQA